MEINFRTLADDIYELYEEENAREPKRDYLGASVIVKPCERQAWYYFRRAYDKRFEGRMLRLFEDGRKAEDRIIEEIKRTGKYVVDEKDANGKQYGFSLYGGHYAGNCDGKILGIIEAPKTWHLIEVKTHNDKSYDWLLNNAVKKGKPEHYDQMQIYMNELGLERGIYIAIKKSSSDIYTERVHREPKKKEAFREKALRVIQSNDAPKKIANSLDIFDCKYCSYNKECYKLEGADLPIKSCRTCLHSTPLIEGGWKCEQKKIVIDEEILVTGCEEHLFLPVLVPGKLVKAEPDELTYMDVTGRTIINKKGEGICKK